MTNQTNNSTIKKPTTWDEWTANFRASRRAEMLRLYENGKGKTMTQIAEIYGISKQRVQQIIRDDEGKE
jgi:DNA-directed RNA polymerase sigma subunit (sigma70/sigma32)